MTKKNGHMSEEEKNDKTQSKVNWTVPEDKVLQ